MNETRRHTDVQVRLLQGALQVVLADGSVVDNGAWRTRKTADLLTMLALAAPAAVPVARLLDSLWPGADETKGRASLRTAASTLRRVLGPDSLQRDLQGLALVSADVDVARLHQLAADVPAACAEGRHDDAVRDAVEADALYQSDLAALDSDSDWASEARGRLRRVFAELLAEGAEAAVAAGNFRAAVALSTRLLELNAFDERAYRCAMLGHAGLGELERAVQMFTRCRDALADELGLDPAPQTRAAYLQVLRAGQEEAGPLPDPETDGLALPELLRRAASAFAGRRIREGNDLVRNARRSSVNPAARAATNLVVAEHAVLLGEAPRVLDLVSAALTDLGERHAPALASGVNTAGLLLLAAHDLGAERPTTSLRHPSVPTWLALRILTERGDLDEAAELARSIPPGADQPLATVLDGMARGALFQALGDLPAALRALRSTLDFAVTADTGLLLPELCARLAMVEAAEDVAAATEHLDLAEIALGEGVFARERCAMLLARAAIRSAGGRGDAAVAGAESAARTAQSLGLVHLAAEAERWQPRTVRASLPRPRRESDVGSSTAA